MRAETKHVTDYLALDHERLHALLAAANVEGRLDVAKFAAFRAGLAVARVELPFHPVLYVALAALHGGLLARVLGDLTGHEGLRSAGAVANAVAIGFSAAAVVYARVGRASSVPSLSRSFPGDQR